MQFWGYSIPYTIILVYYYYTIIEWWYSLYYYFISRESYRMGVKCYVVELYPLTSIFSYLLIFILYAIIKAPKPES